MVLRPQIGSGFSSKLFTGESGIWKVINKVFLSLVLAQKLPWNALKVRGLAELRNFFVSCHNTVKYC